MEQYIYGLHYDYVEQDDCFIVFKKAEGVLLADDLTTLQVHVLQSNKIPHILALEKHELNDEITLLYRYSDLQMLSNVLQTMTFKMTDYYQLLLNVLTVMEQSELYMLDEQCFLLHEHFIAVNRHIDDLYLCYLPVKAVARHVSLPTLLEQFVLSLLPYVEGIQESGLKSIINAIRHPEMSVKTVKSCVISLLESQQGSPLLPKKQSESSKGIRKWFSTSFKFSAFSSRHKNNNKTTVKTERAEVPKDPEQYYRELPQHTTVLKRSSRTQAPAFLHINVDGSVERIALNDLPFSLGRDHVQCIGSMNMLGVSRSHCEIVKVDEQWFIKDLGSSNGSSLNGVELTPNHLFQLHDGDEITIVTNTLTFHLLERL